MDSGNESDEFADGNKKDAAKAMKAPTYGEEQNQEYDAILSALFEKVPPGEGDEFAAVKPWLGAIKEPQPAPKVGKEGKKAPKEKFEIDWVYGYRSEEARMNVSFNSAGHAVYPTAALGVVFDYKNMKQTYFGGGETKFSGRKQDDESKDGHSDDVTACCVSFSRKMVASGQNGQKPLVFLWDATTCEIIGKKRLPKGCRLVTAIGISATDKYIAASDAAEKIAVHLFAVDGGVAPIASVQINMKVVHLAWSPTSEETFATAGKDHMALCVYDGAKSVKMTKGKAGKGKIESQCSAAFSNDPAHKNAVFTGSSGGEVVHWVNGEIAKTYPNNKGSVHSIALRQDSAAGGEVALVGGNDKTLTVYKFDGNLTKLWAVDVDAAPRSCDLFNGQILLGLKNGSLVEIPWNAEGKGKPNVVMTSHCDGEVWGMDIVDLGGGELRMLTSADDNRILAYNPKTKQALAEGQVGDKSKAKKEKKGYRGGASSMSSEPPNCQSRCVAYNAKHKHLAVSDNKGLVTIRTVDWAQVDQRAPGSLDQIHKTLFKTLKKAEWIETMVYSPDDNYLAIGSHDNTIYLVDTKSYSEKKCIKLTGHSSFITALDWA